MSKLLSDILAAGSDRDTMYKQWAEPKQRPIFQRCPAANTSRRITSGELFASKANNTPGYKLGFTVLEGEHTGRKFWHDVWLSAAAMPMAKRDLGKLGVTSLDQLEKSPPKGIRCRVKLALRKDDDGAERNRVITFEVIGVDAPELDAFAPATGVTSPCPQSDAIVCPSDIVQSGSPLSDRSQADGETETVA